VKFGIFYEHQLPRPWEEDSEHTLIQHALEECELAALEVQRRVALATPELRAEPATGRWTWQLRLEGEPVAVAGR